MKILVINAGSSSLKYQLFDMEDKSVLAKGLCERIGIDGRIKHEPSGKEKYVADLAMPNHSEAIKIVVKALTDKNHGVIKDMNEINAVGHRMVHGAEQFTKSILVTDEVMKCIEQCIPLAPLHNPACITGIHASSAVMGNIPQVVVFDTAFHQTMPKKSFMYAIPYRYYEELKIRRYGFHGTSHRYVSAKAAEILGKPYESLKIVTCHLGNGSSLAAVDCGKVLDTSMGLTPLAGVCQWGTRSGDIDPAIVEFICTAENKTAKEVNNILNKESGMIGISGVSSDFRDLQEASEKGNERAKLAVEMFVYSVKKLIGAYAAAMGGIDAIVFTAGVGENSIELRARICEGLEFLGAKMDASKNNIRGKDAIVSEDGSKVKILVVPTNEELVIALDTEAIISAK